MSKEIRLVWETGKTLRFTVQNSAAQLWNGSAWVAPDKDNWNTYGFALTEEGDGSGRYSGNFPPAITTPSNYDCVIQELAAPPVLVVGDLVAGQCSVAWDGTKEEGLTAARLAAIDTNLDEKVSSRAAPGDVPTADEIDGALSEAHGEGDWAGVGLSEEEQAIINAIRAKTDLIGQVGLTYTSPARASGSFLLYGGNDYLQADGLGIGVTVTNYAGPSLVGATGVLRLILAQDYQGEESAAALEVEATVQGTGTTVSLIADLTAEQTADLEPSPPAEARQYVYQFIVTTASGNITLRPAGRMTVLKGITAS